MGKKSGADPDVASGVRLIGKLCGIIYYRQYRIILSAAAAGAVLKPSGGNCAVLP